jgi:hypothetical protein
MIFETPLCEIAYKYGTDKCPQVAHSYTLFYYELLKDKRETFRKVLELGVGTKERMPVNVASHYRTGASLYMWRDFFPNAQIYGMDFDSNAIFQDERITTFLCDERVASDLEGVIEQTGPDIDLFVDDGDHDGCRQVFACRTILPLLKKDVIYIIEDLRHPNRLMRNLVDVGFLCELSAFPVKTVRVWRP